MSSRSMMTQATSHHQAEWHPPFADWGPARRCTVGTCVEVRTAPDRISVRDSKDLADGVSEDSLDMLHVSPDTWLAFLAEVLDQAPAGENGSLFFEHQDDGDVILTSADSDVSLRYDSEEWTAFMGGVADGDFGPVPQTA